MSLREAIINKSKLRGIDPYKDSFRPADLGIKASDFGSFSDYCSENETRSGVWNPAVILKVVARDRGNRPRRYVLIE